MRYPQTYALGIQGKFFHNKLFWYYFLDGLWQSLIIFFAFYCLFDGAIPTADGLDSSSYEMSTSVAILVIVLANIFVGFHTRAWNWLSHFWIYASVIFVFCFIAVYSTMDTDFYGVGFRLFVFTPAFWLAIPPVVVASLLPRCLYFYVKITFFPDDLDLLREIRHVTRQERKMQERGLPVSNS